MMQTSLTVVVAFLLLHQIHGRTEGVVMMMVTIPFQMHLLVVYHKLMELSELQLYLLFEDFIELITMPSIIL